MRALVLTAILLLAFPAVADTVTIGSRVISTGDTIGRVYEIAGKPDRVVRLENRFGAAVGERFEYYRDGKTILIEIAGGVVQAIAVSNG